MGAYDRLIMEAERAAELAELLPELRKHKSMPALMADAQTKVDRANKVHQEVLAKTEEASKALAGINQQVKAAQDKLAAARSEMEAARAEQLRSFDAAAAEVKRKAQAQAAQIVADAQARAEETVRNAQAAVDDRRAEIASLNAEIERLGRDHKAASGKLAGVNKQLEQLRQSL